MKTALRVLSHAAAAAAGALAYIAVAAVVLGVIIAFAYAARFGWEAAG